MDMETNAANRGKEVASQCQSAIDAEAAREASKRMFTRMTLIQEFGLDSAFIGVPKLARILGLTPNTIWNYIRQGKFFIPYRRLNASPVVCIDDLVEWYCRRSDLVLPAPDAATLDEARAHRPAAVPVDRELARADLDAGYDAIVADALASMGLGSRSKPRHASR